MIIYLFLSILIISLLCLIDLLRKFVFKYKSYVPNLPGWLPIFGNIFQIPLDHTKLLDFSRYICDINKTITVWLGIKPVIMTSDINVIQTRYPHKHKSEIYMFLYPWVGTGLLTKNPNSNEYLDWKTRRNQLTPSFHFDMLRNYHKYFQEAALRLSEKCTNDCISSDLRQNNPLLNQNSIDIFSIMTEITLPVIWKTITTNHTFDKNEGKEYIQAVRKISELLIKRYLNPLLWYKIPYELFCKRQHKHVLNILHSYTNKIIDEKRLDYENNKLLPLNSPQISQNDMLTLMFECNLTNKEIKDEINTFIFEGHDTTATSMLDSLFIIKTSDISK